MLNLMNMVFPVMFQFFDVNSIEFYFEEEELICKWDKEMISQKIEFFKARYDYTKNDHNITYKHRYE